MMESTRKRILIVDDEASIAETLRDHLARDHAVEVVSNGDEALAAVSRARPNVVLLDMNMPGMSGLEVLKRLQQIDATIPVIMVTGTDDVPAVGEALKLGAFSYVPKPFAAEYIRHLVAAALSR